MLQVHPACRLAPAARQAHRLLARVPALTRSAPPAALGAEDALRAEGVDVSGCGRAALPSGQGLVLLEADGHATSVVVGGANTDFPKAGTGGWGETGMCIACLHLFRTAKASVIQAAGSRHAWRGMTKWC